MNSNLPDLIQHNYQVVECLNENYFNGRFTYLAKELSSFKKVIIKQFAFARQDSNWSGYKSLEREIKTLQTLEHLNIPKFITSFDSDSGFCLVIQYVDGVPINAKSFTNEEIRQIALSLLDILQYIHEQGIVHRDLKPENILIDGQDKIFLVDFGLATVANGQSLSVSSVLSGTLGFAAPEQLFHNRVSSASDIYSLGITIFSLLNHIPTAKISQLTSTAYEIPIKKYVQDRRWLTWLNSCLERDCDRRFNTAIAAKQKLEELFSSAEMTDEEHRFTLVKKLDSSSNLIIFAFFITCSVAIIYQTVNQIDIATIYQAISVFWFTNKKNPTDLLALAFKVMSVMQFIVITLSLLSLCRSVATARGFDSRVFVFMTFNFIFLVLLKMLEAIII